MKTFFSLLCLLGLCLTTEAFAISPLEPLKTDHPRDTMHAFMSAMNDYKSGVETDNEKLLERLDDAVRTLNLSNLPTVTRKEEGRQAAILLKEVIDRVIVIDYSLIPDDPEIERWRLKGTEIVISKVEEGERKGEFLFSSSTVSRAKEFFERVRDLPYLENTGGGAHYESSWDEKYFPERLRGEFLGIRHWQIAGLFFSIIIGFALKLIVQTVVSIFKTLTSRQEDSIRHKTILALEKPIGLVAATGFWFFSIHYLKFSGFSLVVLQTTIKVTLGVSLVWAAYRLTRVLNDMLLRWAERTKSELDDNLIPMLSKSLRVFIVVFGVLLVVQNLGFNVMSLLAGLGLGGLAFALAAKDTAANLFGSIMILIDRPFRVGDWIKSNDVEGNVESIGFRSTRIRTFYNSLISVPNSILATTNIDNMGLREYRRTYTTLGVTYDTPSEKIEAFTEGIRKIILDNECTRKDSLHIAFSGYGDFSLNIMLYFFLKVPDFATEVVEREKIYMKILRLAKSIDVEFAFPTNTLHIESLPESGLARE